MIQRTYPDIYTAWRSLVDELCYAKDITPIRWGVCMSYPDLLEADIEDALLDSPQAIAEYDPRRFSDPDRFPLSKSGEWKNPDKSKGGMHLDMSSYTKSRWTRFLRRYFRPDLGAWVDTAMKKLQKYPKRPFVASYSIQINVDDEEGRKGHNYGGCLSSLQIRIYPKPTVILYSRACQMDKIGFLDFALMHLVAKRMGLPEVSARWVVSLPFVSAISQVYYSKRFKLNLKGHLLKSRIEQHIDLKPSDTPYGPLSRLLKRNIQFKERGTIPRSVRVENLSLEFEPTKPKKPRIRPKKPSIATRKKKQV